MTSRKITVKECKELLDLSSMYIHKMMLSSNSCSQSFAEFLNNNFTTTDFVFTMIHERNSYRPLQRHTRKEYLMDPFRTGRKCSNS